MDLAGIFIKRSRLGAEQMSANQGDGKYPQNTSGGGEEGSQRKNATDYHSTTTFQPSSPEQLIWLAEELLNNPVYRTVMERVGLHGDLTDEQDKSLDAFIEGLVAKRGWGRHHPFNLSLAVVLARRFAANVFKDAHSEEVAAFLEHNTMKQAPKYKPTPKPHYNELILFANALRNDTEFNAIIGVTTGRLELNDQEFEKYLNFQQKIRKKYGLLNRDTPAFGEAILLNRMLAKGEIASFSDEKALQFLSRHKGTMVAACVFEGMSNV